MSKERLAILGAGDLGRQLAHWATTTQQYEVTGFLDDTMPGMQVDGCPVIGGISETIDLYSRGLFDCVIIAVGYHHFDFREKLFNHLAENQVPFATIIAPNVYIDPTAHIGAGCVLYPGCIIDYEAYIGDNVILNLGSIISHNSRIGNHSFIAPGAVVAGFSSVGSKSFIGANAVISEKLSMADSIIIGAGAVVTKSLCEEGTYVKFNFKLK
jgi:sugar O-acyltransferase (sialic acid O-acetyltransferase NeuD family)